MSDPPLEAGPFPASLHCLGLTSAASVPGFGPFGQCEGAVFPPFPPVCPAQQVPKAV